MASPTEKTWEDTVREKQQEWYETFGDRDWDEYKNSLIEQEYFMRNVGHSVYGPPDEEPSEENMLTGYSNEKFESIKAICDTIRKNDVHRPECDADVYVGVIFVYLENVTQDLPCTSTVVFRVPKKCDSEKNDNIFIDTTCRTYSGWNDYLKNNKLPKCKYCYPKSGVYYGDDKDKVLVEFGTTPSGNLRNKVLDSVDAAGTVVSVGTTLVTLAAFVCPVTAPVMMATAVTGGIVGAYGTARCAESLYDRKKHGQSINITEPEARSSWLSLGASVLGMAAAGASRTAASMARNGRVLGTAGQLIIDATQIGSLTINGINIVNTFFILKEKSLNDTLTKLDVFQFASSILFFTSSAWNLKSAQQMFKEHQQNVLQEFETSLRSNRHRKAHARVARNTRKGLNQMHGDAKVIKHIRHVTNVDDFYAGIVRRHNEFRENNAHVTYSGTGLIEINHDLVLDPAAFAGIEKTSRQTILSASNQFRQGEITHGQYESLVNPILHEFGLDSSSNVAGKVGAVCKAFGVKNLSEVKVAGQSILSNIDGKDLEKLVKLSSKLLSPKILEIAIDFAEKLQLRGTANFLCFLKFCIKYIKDLLNELEEAYMVSLNLARSWTDFDQHCFDSDNGIPENRLEYFLSIIKSMGLSWEKLTILKQRYEEYCRQPAGTSETAEASESNNNHPCESTSMCNTETDGLISTNNQTDLSFDRDLSSDGPLSTEEYFALSQAFFRFTISTENATLNHFGNVTFVNVKYSTAMNYVVVFTSDAATNKITVKLLE